MDAKESMKKQNELAMFLARHVFSSEAKHSNIVFSPASIYSALTLVASAPSEPSVTDEILCFLKSSSTDELNAVFTELVSLVYTGGNASGGPEISSVNGVWIEKTLSLDPKLKDLLENFFKAASNLVDFVSEVNLSVLTI